MNQTTKSLIEKFSPMWTNKQIWEFDQLNEDLRFDAMYVKPQNYDDSLWKSKSSFLNSEIRDTIVRTFDHMIDGEELWISNVNERKIDEKYVPYLMAVMADVMIEEEICLNFRIENECFVSSIDSDADVIDCKEFFEEFYHLATGFNYEQDTGIPQDENEAEIYLTRLQEEFDEKMKGILGDKYLPGNNDPDTINAK
ncbi:hypothetical protein NKOR_05045 [Candidatus Nitrosopumilus koreensis AR1]|uniref:Uncharacterized protein n=1 Tax=Candidatus Nitrosopumilus koreensis AR1 TaxID=1229908 RepID=K0B7J5_9ARCH|nr:MULTISPECIES: hypothetical protein [Nitrosopumilus]AFS80895.1 hypothetical protein NKOR_05045 [Candidatus Nitrosopumilus koreensis AR1]